MAMDPIQQSPFVYYPQVAATGGDISKSFSSGYTAEQQHAANALAMDAARQTEVMNQQSMRLKDTEEARKQALFKQGMADRARIASLAATPFNPNLPGNAPPVGAPSGGGGDAVLPPVTQPFRGGVSAGTEDYRSAPAPAPAPAPAAPAPGPRAEYEPSSQKPDWYNPQPRTAGLAGPQFAQNTTQTNDARGGGYGGTRPAVVPAVNPYGEVNPNAPQATQDFQRMQQGLRTDNAFSNIQARLGQGFGFGTLGDIGNYFSGTPQDTSRRANQAAAAAWYESAEGQTLLRSNPQLLQAAVQDPLGVFNARYSLPEYLGKYGRQDGAQSTAPMESNYTDTPPRQLTPEQKRTGYEENYPVITLPAAKPDASGVNTNKDIAANIAESKSVQTAINLQGAFEGFDTKLENRKLDVDIAMYKRQYEMSMKARDFAGANEAQVKATQAILAKEQLSYMGIIHQFQNNNYAPLANALNAQSRENGGDMKLQPRWDGKFNLFNGKELISGEDGLTKEQLILASRQKFDMNYKAQVAALQKAQAAAVAEGLKAGAKANAEVPAKAAEAQLKAESDMRAKINEALVKFGQDVSIKRMEFANEAEKAAALAASNSALKILESKLSKGQKIIESKEVPGVFIQYDEVGGGTTSAFRLVPRVIGGKIQMEADGKTPQLEKVIVQ